jgi:hypothetical protein
MQTGKLVALFALLLSSAACVASPQTDSEGDAVSEASLEAGRANASGFEDVPDLTAAEKQAILARYAAIPHAGIRAALYEKAILYYDTNKSRITNKRWLSVIDFAKHSREHRFFLLDMQGGPMKSYVIAHGKNSDPDNDGVATSFSNVDGSNKSSVGYYVTADTYVGDHGRSLLLDGLSTTNSNVRARSIVIHGADYVEDGRAVQGRSLGCPAFSNEEVQGVIDKIQDGSIIYAWN